MKKGFYPNSSNACPHTIQNAFYKNIFFSLFKSRDISINFRTNKNNDKIYRAFDSTTDGF